MNKSFFTKLLTFFVFGLSVSAVFGGNNMLIKSLSYSLTAPHDSLIVIVPNVFTPNGDGVNDTWSIGVHDYGIAVLELQATVYDRWGKMVFNTTNIHQVWSGHNLIGKPCDDGTYFYVLSYLNGSSHNREVFKGFIELLR